MNVLIFNGSVQRRKKLFRKKKYPIYTFDGYTFSSINIMNFRNILFIEKTRHKIKLKMCVFELTVNERKGKPKYPYEEKKNFIQY